MRATLRQAGREKEKVDVLAELGPRHSRIRNEISNAESKFNVGRAK